MFTSHQTASQTKIKRFICHYSRVSTSSTLSRSYSSECKKPKHQSYLTAINQKDYVAALRKAAAAGEENLVDLILKYKNWLAQDFDINETSKTGNKTAYQWIEESKIVPSPIKNRIKKKLISAGATITSSVPITIAQFPS